MKVYWARVKKWMTLLFIILRRWATAICSSNESWGWEKERKSVRSKEGRHEPYMCCRSGNLLLLRMTSSSNYRIETGKSRDNGRRGRLTWLGSLSNDASPTWRDTWILLAASKKMQVPVRQGAKSDEQVWQADSPLLWIGLFPIGNEVEPLYIQTA